jgi:hypothetical protein
MTFCRDSIDHFFRQDKVILSLQSTRGDRKVQTRQHVLAFCGQFDSLAIDAGPHYLSQA